MSRNTRAIIDLSALRHNYARLKALAPDSQVMAVVNLQHVRETEDRDGLRLVLSDGSHVGVSRSRRSHVEALLSPRLR